MLSIIGVLAAGILIGSFAPLGKKSMRLNSRLQFWGLMALLFLMGTSIGMDESLVAGLSTIGFDSFVYALSAAFFSTLFVYFLTGILFERR